jgi:hypothetical protein
MSDTAYHSFIGEVEALNTTTIRRLTPSCRHQLLAIALEEPPCFARDHQPENFSRGVRLLTYIVAGGGQHASSLRGQ